MGRFTHFRIFVLALMLAVSHVALLSHVTAHFQPAIEQCELCVSEAELLAALPAVDRGVSAESNAGGICVQAHSCSLAAWSDRGYLERAPPILSA